MIVITDPSQKKQFREIENRLFDEAASFRNRIKMRFSKKVLFDHCSLDDPEILNFITHELPHSDSFICISTFVAAAPIFLFDIKNDSLEEYQSLLLDVGYKIDNNGDSEPLGLTIQYEKILLYDKNELWCGLVDRYADKMFFAIS